METPTRRPPFLLVLSGPAGSGKNTVAARLLRAFPETLSRAVTATTRAPRAGEKEDVDYIFLRPEEFARREAAGEFFETAEVHGRRYGTLRGPILETLASGRDVLLIIDVQGAAAFRAATTADQELRGRLATVFIHADDATLKARMRERGCDDEAEVARRLETARREREHWRAFDYRIPTASREEDYDRFRAIYLAERLRVTVGKAESTP